MTPNRIDAGTRGSYAIKNLSFTFSPEWDGLVKKLVFYPRRGLPVYGEYTGGEVVIPSRLMACVGENTFTISGYSVTDEGYIGQKIVSAGGAICVSLAPDDMLLEPNPPEASVFEEILAKIGAPYISEDETWMLWDKDMRDFVDSRMPARGAPGRGLKVLDTYDTLEELDASVKDPEIGDAYGVGTSAPYRIYIYNGRGWKDHGYLRGERGNGIASMRQTAVSEVSDGENVFEFISDDGDVAELIIRNGKQGERGVPGNVHIGPDTPPLGAVIWLNPNGTPDSPAQAPVIYDMPVPCETYRGCIIIVPEGDTDKLYMCLMINGEYTWKPI